MYHAFEIGAVVLKVVKQESTTYFRYDLVFIQSGQSYKTMILYPQNEISVFLLIATILQSKCNRAFIFKRSQMSIIGSEHR